MLNIRSTFNSSVSVIIKGKYNRVEINKKYSNPDLTIFELLEKIKTSPEVKRDIRESNILILNVGYNDLIYKLSLEKNLTQNLFQKRMNEITNSYQQLIKEIKKYYANKIIVIGYYQRNINDYYQNLGIRKLNSILKDNSEIIYINTIFLLNNSNNYFQNPNSYYPNQLAYQKIAEEIYKKTLENNIIIWYSNMALNYYDEEIVMAEGEILWKKIYIQK